MQSSDSKMMKTAEIRKMKDQEEEEKEEVPIPHQVGKVTQNGKNYVLNMMQK